MTDNSITVIGSGATALAAAAYLTIKGKQVILCDREQGQRFRDIEDGGGITLEGVMETGSPVLPFRMTDDFQDAVGNARRILVAFQRTGTGRLRICVPRMPGKGRPMSSVRATWALSYLLTGFTKRGKRVSRPRNLWEISARAV